MIGGGVPMKDHDKWLQVAVTNGVNFGDGLRQRYNKSRIGTARAGSDFATGENPAASYKERAATTPLVFLDRTSSKTRKKLTAAA
jgi:hypothetical protein